MNSMIYKKKTPLLLFLIPAFAFLLVFLYYPFFQNILNTFLKIGGLGRADEGLNEPYVSQWHLSKLLNRYTEKSFYDILNSQRVRAAKALLSDPSLRIGEIAERVGYTDTAHFARVFKKLTSMSANEYRNSL